MVKKYHQKQFNFLDLLELNLEKETQDDNNNTKSRTKSRTGSIFKGEMAESLGANNLPPLGDEQSHRASEISERSNGSLAFDDGSFRTSRARDGDMATQYGLGGAREFDRGELDSSVSKTRFTTSKLIYNLQQNTTLNNLSKLEKAKGSILAIQTLKNLQLNQNPSKEQQDDIAKYIGFGGVPQLFDENNSDYKELRDTLKNITTAKEYTSLRDSTSDSFYTNKILVDATYKILNKAGFLSKQNLHILEPSCGGGNYIGFMPQNFRDNNKIYGYELDYIASSVAKALYESDNIKIRNKPFQNHNPANKVDIVIGNFPFGNQNIYDSSSIASGNNLHNYFLLKSIESLHNKGLMVAITSNNFLNFGSKELKQEIDTIADFIGAIRLPKEAFKSANTQALCDIVIFQKNDNKIINKEEYKNEDHWVNKDFINNFNVENSNYFVKQIGNASLEKNQYGKEFFNFSEDFNNLESVLNNIIDEKINDLSQKFIPLSQHQQIDINNNKYIKEVPQDIFVEEIYVYDGKIYKRVANDLSGKRGEILELSEVKQNKLKQYCKIKESLKDLLRAEINNNEETDINKLRENLNIDYKNFVNSFGNLNNSLNKNLFLQEDTKARLVLGLEKTDGKKIVLAQVFSKRLVEKKEIKIDNLKDAIYLSLSSMGEIDCSYIASIKQLQYSGDSNKVKADLLDKNLAFFNPKLEIFQISEQYLSGNILEKLQDIDNYPTDYDLSKNVKALKNIMPKRVSFADIGISLTSHFIPLEYKKDFINSLLSNDTCVDTLEYEPITASYDIKINSYRVINFLNDVEYGTSAIGANEIIEKIFNNQSIVVKNDVRDGDKIIKVVNNLETELALDKANIIGQKFYDYLANCPIKSKNIEDIYNNTFNVFVAPLYKNGNQLSLINSSKEISLRPHQKEAVLRGILEDKYLLDHVVGSGKTYTMIATIMERKRLGKSNKPILVVPNHLLGQWRKSFNELYPNSNVLVADEKNFSKDKRESFITNIALNNWDCIVISHSAFEKIPMSQKFLTKALQKEIELLDEIMLENTNYFATKRLKKVKEAYQSKLQSFVNVKVKDKLLSFDQTGIDEIYVDEAHEFKNLQFHTKQSDIAGINPVGSQKAYDLFTKVQFIQKVYKEKTGKANGGVFFATGTPISNSLAELYTLSKYLDSEKLNKLGCLHFDAWANSFSKIVDQWQVSSSGVGFERKRIFAEFKNIPELSNAYLGFADFIGMGDIKDYIKVPKLLNNKANSVIVEATDEQKKYMENIVERMHKIKSQNIDPKIDNPLKVCSDGKKSSIDMRLIDSTYSECNKVLHLVEQTKRLYDKWEEDKGTQLIFCDMSVPKKFKENNTNDIVDSIIENNFSIYFDIKEKLIKNGINPEEIAFIHSADSDEKKAQLFDNVNQGKIRVLLGSSQKMGAGMNVQERLVALHHLDAPWRPTDLEQREGRIIRQGNKLLEKYGDNFNITINRYATKNMYDSRLWQILENKAKFIEQFRKGNIKTRAGEDVGEVGLGATSAEEMKAIASGNPYLMLLIKLKAEYKKADNIYNRALENRKLMQKNIDAFEKKEHKEYNSVIEKINQYQNILSKKQYDIEVIKAVDLTIIKEKNTNINIYRGEKVLSDLQIKNLSNKFEDILTKNIDNKIDAKNKIELDIAEGKKALEKPLSSEKLLILKGDVDKCQNALEEFDNCDKKHCFLPKSSGFDKEVEQIKTFFNIKTNSKENDR